MIKRKLFSVLATTSMIASLFATTALAADWNTQGGEATITGTSVVQEPTIEVSIPGELSFALNPLSIEIDQDDSTKNKAQVISSQFPIINYSNTPVVVETKTSAAGASGVNVKTTADYDANTKALKTSKADDKDVFLCISVDKTAQVSGEDWKFTFNEIDETVKDAASATTKGGLAIIGGAGSEAKATFALSAASGPNAVTEAAAFKLVGAVNPQATYAEGDVTVTTVYTLTAVTEDQRTKGYEKDSTKFGTDVADTVVTKK